jgi:hypothetical protein
VCEKLKYKLQVAEHEKSKKNDKFICIKEQKIKIIFYIKFSTENVILKRLAHVRILVYDMNLAWFFCTKMKNTFYIF